MENRGLFPGSLGSCWGLGDVENSADLTPALIMAGTFTHFQLLGALPEISKVPQDSPHLTDLGMAPGEPGSYWGATVASKELTYSETEELITPIMDPFIFTSPSSAMRLQSGYKIKNITINNVIKNTKNAQRTCPN